MHCFLHNNKVMSYFQMLCFIYSKGLRNLLGRRMYIAPTRNYNLLLFLGNRVACVKQFSLKRVFPIKLSVEKCPYSSAIFPSV